MVLTLLAHWLALPALACARASTGVELLTLTLQITPPFLAGAHKCIVACMHQQHAGGQQPYLLGQKRKVGLCVPFEQSACAHVCAWVSVRYLGTHHTTVGASGSQKRLGYSTRGRNSFLCK
jgi:hypothetical protein